MLLTAETENGGHEPWFRRRPQLALGLSAAMYLAVWLLPMGLGAGEDIALLFTFPITLLAVTFGVRMGLLAGAFGAGLLVVWALTTQVPLPAMGWAVRVAPMLLIGMLLGDAVDRLRRAERERQRLLATERRQRDVIEINDSIMQQLSAAKWALESGDTENGLKIVTETLRRGNPLVSQLIRDADISSQWIGRSTDTVNSSSCYPAPSV